MLVACPGCRRHVRCDSGCCPFCAHALVPTAPLDLDLPRMSRASLAALAAVGAISAACSRSSEPTITAEPSQKPIASTVAPAPSPSSSSEDAGLAYGGLGLTGAGMGAAYGAPPPPGLLGGLAGIGAPSAAVDVAVIAHGAKIDVDALELQEGRFRACAVKARAADPTTSGAATVEASISTEGAVTITSTKKTGTLPATFEACVRTELLSMKLAKRTAAGTCSVTVNVKR